MIVKYYFDIEAFSGLSRKSCFLWKLHGRTAFSLLFSWFVFIVYDIFKFADAWIDMQYIM